MIRKTIKFTIILGILISSTSFYYLKEFNISGVYRLNCYLDHITLNLKDNNTFEYDAFQQGLLMSWSKTSGTWTIKDSILLLNSKPDKLLEKKYKYEVIKEVRNEKGSIKIELVDITQNPIPNIFCELKLKGKVIGQNFSRKNGLLSFPNINSDEIHILPVSNYNDVHLKINHKHEKNYNYYKFILKKDDGYYRTDFYNVKLIVRENILIIPNVKIIKGCDNFYKKSVP